MDGHQFEPVLPVLVTGSVCSGQVEVETNTVGRNEVDVPFMIFPNVVLAIEQVPADNLHYQRPRCCLYPGDLDAFDLTVEHGRGKQVSRPLRNVIRSYARVDGRYVSHTTTAVRDESAIIVTTRMIVIIVRLLRAQCPRQWRSAVYRCIHAGSR